MKYPISKATLSGGDIEIGAVELKDASADTRAKVGASGSIAEGNNVVGVQAPVLGATDGAAIAADGAATIQQYLRSLFKEFLSRVPEQGYENDAAPTQITMNGSTQRSAQLAAGNYVLHATEDCTFLAGGSGVNATATDIPLDAGNLWLHRVTSGNDYIAALAASGTFSIIPV